MPYAVTCLVSMTHGAMKDLDNNGPLSHASGSGVGRSGVAYNVDLQITTSVLHEAHDRLFETAVYPLQKHIDFVEYSIQLLQFTRSWFLPRAGWAHCPGMKSITCDQCRNPPGEDSQWSALFTYPLTCTCTIGQTKVSSIWFFATVVSGEGREGVVTSLLSAR